MSKRKRAESKSSIGGLKEDENKLLDLIRSKEGMGATTFEMKLETKIVPALITRSIASLKKNHLIKEVPNINNKGIKHFLAVEFAPCKELTGGDWYNDGTLNIEKIEDLKGICVAILDSAKDRVVTFEILSTYFEKTKDKLTREQVKQILKNLVLDNVIMEVTSNGLGEFSSTRIGQVCYKLTGRKSDNGKARAGAFASVPCGACPHIALCSPDGVISPTTCDYFQKWLDF
ncbi:unnamed protein product [Arabis nemorensis]|uniref:RNA polymerase III subunit C6 n=1 Tax=Arabis nemorensis TaxID=586526 RepID=A0A565CUQ7_9BRAS|nr:unnamed protein product [Arabis nemorensis]